MDIVIIGSGNVAAVMGQKLLAAGHHILQVAGRNASQVAALARSLQAEAGDLTQIHPGAMLYLVCISDQALPDLHLWFRTEKAIVVHTAGSVSREVLAPVARNYGVLWPLQSLRRESAYIPPFPLVIDANTPECLTVLHDLATQLSAEVRVMDDGQRRKMHLAAVMAGNFANHLFAMVKQYCEEEQLNFQLLQPLLQETVDRLSYADPARMQTGPAIRGDQQTMEAHQALLASYPDLLELYRYFSALIMKK